MRKLILLAGVVCCFAQQPAPDVPQAAITNGQIRATLLLPDPVKGYYRATRFDWSGVIASLEFKGHNYFGQWFPRYDPKLHDAIMGPVEEFLTDGAGLGYADAKVGETFVKIGVGSVRKPQENAFRQFNTYEIVDNGKWIVNKTADSVEFIQELTDPSGYAYIYRKKVSLVPGKPVMMLEHSLKNTGSKLIDTNVYDHNFFVMDGQTSGPGFQVRFPFELKTTRDLRGFAEAQGKQLVYLKGIGQGQSIITDLQGYGSEPADYDIRVENTKLGAGVRVTADKPLARVVFWSAEKTLCPEAYLSFHIEPGKQADWKISYEFYTLP